MYLFINEINCTITATLWFLERRRLYHCQAGLWCAGGWIIPFLRYIIYCSNIVSFNVWAKTYHDIIQYSLT